MKDFLRELCRTGQGERKRKVLLLLAPKLGHLRIVKVVVGAMVIKSSLALLVSAHRGQRSIGDETLTRLFPVPLATVPPALMYASNCPTSFNACSGSEHFASNGTAPAEDTLPG